MDYAITTGATEDATCFGELAALPGVPAAGPDGICLDRDGAVWWADPLGRRVVRMTRGGAVTDEIRYSDMFPTAVALGGTDRRSLFICLVERVHRDETAAAPRSRVDVIEVAVAGAGRP
jgi:sugar lactone lactonase YvrE